MRVLIVGAKAPADALARALEGQQIEVERPPKRTVPDSGADEVAQIAAALLAFEAVLNDDAPDAVLLSSTSNVALAALLAATKLRIPVANLRNGFRDEDRLSEMNGRLIEQLADATLAGDGGTIVDWLRDRAVA